ncbi:MAG: L-threonylcarbamoyladenylate synthase [Moraxellaceae bacterium]|nr:L-threonylcarbamoyladenylate synthase [Moraxellaceae bacterium]
MTLLLNINVETDFAQAVSLLQAGELVAVPTETVYGLAADARQPKAVSSIFAAKNRPANHPLIVHIGEMAQLDDWAIDIPSAARQLVRQFWPGPLTLILRKAPCVNSIVTGGHDTVALRMPAHPALLDLLKRSGLALAAPSANPHKRLSPTSAHQVMDTMAGKIAAVLDGGECSLGIESTILDFSAETPRVLRPGPITASELAEHLGSAVTRPNHHHLPVPGNLPEHYRPRTPVRLKTAHEIMQNTDYPVVRLMLSPRQAYPKHNDEFLRVMPQAKPLYAQQLYRTLHEADQMAACEIWVELPPASEQWSDVYDRLLRASGGS